MLVTLIDRTCQQGMQIMIHSPMQLGVIAAHNMLTSKEAKQSSSSEISQVQPPVSNQQTAKTADGRSRQITMEPSATPSATNQVPTSLKNEKRGFASPDEHALSTTLQDLRDRYAFAYGEPPRGRQGNIASWLHVQIQAAQHQVIYENAATGDQSESTCLTNTLATDDRVFSTVVTRAAQQAIDLTVNYDGAIDNNKLAQHSPKRQRVSDGTMIMGASVKAIPDPEILELKNEYNAHFGHLPRGRFANQSSWLTSAIARSIRLKSNTQSIAQVSTPKSMMIPETTSDPPHVDSPFERKILTVGLSTIPASDYSFPAGDKGMTFGASTVNSVHIKTIALDGMAALLFGRKLSIGCMITSIQGHQISDGTNALAIVQAHALLRCILTISVPPEDNVAWVSDDLDMVRPLENFKTKIDENNGAVKDRVHTSTSPVTDTLASPMMLTTDFVHTATDFVMHSHPHTTSDYKLQKLGFNARQGDIVLAAKPDGNTFRKAMVVSVDLPSETAYLVYFHDHVNYSDECQLVPFSRLMRWTVAGPVHKLTPRGAQQHTRVSPCTRSGMTN
jgi:hypothetical protein